MTEAIRAEPGVAASEGEVNRTRKFGADSLKVGGKIVAMLVNESLVVKLPRQRVEALVADGSGNQFDPGHGRPMKEWLRLRPDAPVDWLLLVKEALDFVGRGRTTDSDT